MGSWGRKGEEALTGTGAITANTDIVTGTLTVFESEVAVDDLITVGVDTFRVVAVNSNTEIQVVPVSELGITATTMVASEAPKYLPLSEISNVVYVETSEIDANTRADGIKTPGWTLYEEYGSGRKRVETLVAMKSTS